MVTVVLFNDCKFDNRYNASNFADKTHQYAYFDTLSSVINTGVKFESMSKPILLNMSYDDIINYAYGYIVLDTKRYFFSVRQYEIETVNKTWLYYDLDYWETYRYDRLKIGKCLIRRCTLELPFRPLDKIGCSYQVYNKIKDIEFNAPAGNTAAYQLFFTYHDSTLNKDYVGFYDTIDRDHLIPDWATIGINPTDIMGVWLTPFYIPYTFATSKYSDNYVKVHVKPYDSYVGGITHNYLATIDDAVSDETHTLMITDMTGTPIYSYPRFHNGSLSIVFKFDCSMTAAFFDCAIDGQFNDLSLCFTLPMIPVDLFTDTYTEYINRERAYLIEQRNIQRDQSLVNSLTNLGQSAIGGGVAGSVAGAGAAGAIAGVAADVAGAAIRYFTDSYFNDRTTNNDDRYARVALDTLKVIGNSLIPFLDKRTGVRVYSVTADTNAIANFTNQLTTYGYEYNSEYLNFGSILSGNISFSFIGEVEMSGIETAAVETIRNRFRNGVKFGRGS